MHEIPFNFNSSIEFVLIGPYNGRDRILIKSVDAGLDLVGFAIRNWELKESKIPQTFDFPQIFDLMSVLIQPVDIAMNRISSQPQFDIIENSDERNSKFLFAWKGLTSDSAKFSIEKYFNLIMADVRFAIMSSEKDRVEMAIAPLINRCNISNIRRLRYRRLLIYMIFSYFSIAATIVLVLSVKNFVTLVTAR